MFVKICDVAVKQRIVRPNHELFRKGHNGHMYFVARGQLRYLFENVMMEECSDDEGEEDVTEKDWVSEPALWLDGWKHRGSLIAKMHCEMLRIDKDIFNQITHDIEGVNRYRQAFITCGMERVDVVPRTERQGMMLNMNHLVETSFYLDQELLNSFASVASTNSTKNWFGQRFSDRPSITKKKKNMMPSFGIKTSD